MSSASLAWNSAMVGAVAISTGSLFLSTIAMGGDEDLVLFV